MGKDPYSDYRPQIRGLELEALGNQISSIKTLDIYQLYECTRRNCAVFSDLRALHRKTGGVLLSLHDLVNWKDFEALGSNDALKGTFKIRETDIEAFDSTVVQQLDSQELATLKLQDRRIGLIFIYEDHCLKGSAGQLRFWRNQEDG